MAAAMIGEGEAIFGGERMPAAEALAKAGIEPAVLAPKEGLGLINGTQFSTACALVGLFRRHPQSRGEPSFRPACRPTRSWGRPRRLEEGIHAFRGHRGQIDVARAMRAVMAGLGDP
jgi:histidine ammonia-lyase